MKRFFKQWHWLIAILLIPYSYFVWINTPSQHYDKPNCSEYHTGTARNEVVLPATDETPEYTKTEYDEKQRLEASLDCSGLEVQWVMADITYHAFWAGVAGIALVLLTWVATRESVWISERIGKKQTRAYLSLSNVTFSTKNTFGLPSVKMTVKNTGNSPASEIFIRDVSFKIDITLATVWSKARSFSESNDKGFSHFVPDIMAGETGAVDGLLIARSTKDVSKIGIYKAKAFIKTDSPLRSMVEVFCNLEYVDVFGDKCITPYRFFAGMVGADFSNVEMRVLRAESVASIRKHAKAYADNKAQELVKAELNRP